MLDKHFDHRAAERRLYSCWEAAGAFAAGTRPEAAPYTIMIPPPNVTGSLHVGHALTYTLQDVLTRHARMTGRDTLWQPGTDHAGIATQMVVERLLAAEGTDRRALGRAGFTERVWAWKTESGGAIEGQLRRLGASLDWPRARFTLDEGLSAAVREMFVRLHRAGLIYRDRRLVNWDPKLQSAISDLEVEQREVAGKLYYVRYRVDGGDETLTVATTRPETMLGDTAVAVHPEDPRYAALVGRMAVLPLTGRRVPIVADAYSDPEKGTGAVKITPAHDFNDWEVGRRHDLPSPSVLDREARVTLAEIADTLAAIPEYADPAFVHSLAGQGREAARAAMVAELDRLGLLDRVEPHTHTVPHGDRSGVVLEPLLTLQWYCNAEVLARPAIQAVERGRVRFVPQQWENTFFAWMRDIKPWCISRQLWWGHRIPAWYGPDGAVFVAHDAAEAAALARAAYGRDEPLVQDEDVLDTWFSSGLWPFSTLGWPEATAELARRYPTDVLVTGFDIIFFWVARMMMFGLFAMGDVPFRTVAVHGLVRDERGQKMSKSRGNVIDPLAMIDEYGADALRFAMCQVAGPGRDARMGTARIEAARAFVTKIWNAARFAEMNGVRPAPGFDPAEARTPLARFLLDAANTATGEASAALAAFRFDEYAAALYRFVWNVYCDWFLELAKSPLAGEGADAAEIRAAGAHVLGVVLRLLHPVMPFVTEELWGEFGFGAPLSLVTAHWPEPARVHEAVAARSEVGWVIRCITAIRALRSEMNVPAGAKLDAVLRDAAPETASRAEAWAGEIARLARLGRLTTAEGASAPEGAAQIVLDEATLLVPLAGHIDLGAERNRLARERARAEAEAAKLGAKLANADFLARAKPEVVAETRDRASAASADAARLGAALARLGAV